jgi:bifunctional UDP-N-acetylglucosamine pyrophosphorylase / glucosamine-1-phosphate N-acetyltransferase
MGSRTGLAIVLAAGEGTRMASRRPKVLHAIGGRSLLGHVLAAIGPTPGLSVVVVIGRDQDAVRAETRRFRPDAQIAIQNERRGTAHAVLSARDALIHGFDDILVLFGDTPLIKPATVLRLRDALAGGAAVAVLGFRAADPTGYGRLIVKGDRLGAIREERDATPED